MVQGIHSHLQSFTPLNTAELKKTFLVILNTCEKVNAANSYPASCNERAHFSDCFSL